MLGLAAPTIGFIVVFFALPLALFLFRSVDNPEVHDTLPRTLAALAHWDRRTLTDEAAFAALLADLKTAQGKPELSMLARRLNYVVPGFRSIIIRTARLSGEATPAYRGLPDRARAGLARRRPLGRDRERVLAADRLLPARRARPASDRRGPHRARRSAERGVPRSIRAHVLDQPHGHAVLPRDRISGRRGDRARQARHREPAADPGAAAVLVLAAGARDRLDHPAAGRRAGEPGADRARRDRAAGEADLQPHRARSSR